MIKYLLFVFAFIISVNVKAQQGTASPYSFYGIGSLKFKGTVENRSMGGLSVYNDSIRINLRNPAFYGGQNFLAYNNESRPVTYSVGGSTENRNLKSDLGSGKTSSTSFDYLAISIPINKLGIGFGLMPYTSVGYKLENRNEASNVSHRYRGEGGVNRTYLSLGYQLDNKLSFGITADYNFGKITNATVQYLYNENNEPLAFDTREDNRSDLSGLSFNLGVAYSKKISETLELQTALAYSPEAKLTSNNQRSISRIITDDFGNEAEFDTIESDLESQGLKKTDLVIPSKLTIGAGIGEPRKWFAGIDLTTQNTSNFENALYNYQNVEFENATSVSIGGFFIPKYNSFSSYLKRVVYRSGIRFENTGLKVNNQSIKEFGISFGLGLPVGSGRDFFSNANLGIEIGQRGTTSANLVKENFVNFQLSLSLNDRWFKKRQFD